MRKRILKYAISLLVIPLVVIFGFVLFDDRKYAFISLAIALLACVPFFLTFEKKESSTKKMIVIAVMIAISVSGRFLFAPIPFFKPVTAIVVITALYMGAEAGFLTGALTAVISNLYFGQGPWTPFQMVVWGLIGFFAGLMAKQLLESRLWLSLYGVFAGIIFSLVMDVWTVLWWDGSFNKARYIAALISAAPITVVYAVSNVIFLLALARPMGEKLGRIKLKYGL